MTATHAILQSCNPEIFHEHVKEKSSTPATHSIALMDDHRRRQASQKAKAIARNILGCALMLFLMAVGAIALLVPVVAFAQQSPAMQTWQQSISATVPTQSGCYEASYPSTQWQQVACAQPQAITAPASLPPRNDDTGAAAPVGNGAATVGHGTDYRAAVSSGKLISSIQGSFANVTGVSSIVSDGIEDKKIQNSYSLQINTNKFVFSGDALCRSSTGSCTGWQQFIYSNDSSSQGSLHIQYWILASGYGIGNSTITNASQCPASWTPYPADTTNGKQFMGCYTDSSIAARTTTPAIAPSNLGNIALIGSTANGSDTAIININGKAYTTVRGAVFKALPQSWINAEFNVFGYHAGYPIARFNNGASLTVKTAVTNGATNPPVCLGGGTTGESTNLYFNSPCCPFGGANPMIAFVEGTVDDVKRGPNCSALGNTLGIATPTFNVTASPNPSSAATVSPASARVALGDSILFTMTQQPGYSLLGASFVDGTNQTNCPLTPLGGSGNVSQFRLGPITSDCAIVGYFGAPNAPTYTVSASASPSQAATITPTSNADVPSIGSVKVTSGATVVFTMTQEAGYGLVSAAFADGASCPLTGLGGSGNVYQFALGPITSNCKIVGHFGAVNAPRYTVAVNASPSNLATISPASLQVAAGDTVRFTITQQPGHSMTGSAYTLGSSATCPATGVGNSGNVVQVDVGPITGNCTLLGYFK